MSDLITDADLFERLKQFSFDVRRNISSSAEGNLRKLRKGTGGEFADYRNYGVGDEIKYIDWNIYARSNKLFSKVFYEEGNLDIHLLLDVSKSMDYGKDNKLSYAKNIIMMLAYIGVTNNHNVQFTAFADDIFLTMPFGHHVDAFGHFLETLETLQSQGQTQLNQSMFGYLQKQKPSGLIFIVSDFLDGSGYEKGLTLLAHNPIQVCCIQLLCKEEIDPKVSDIARLQDIETNRLINFNLTRSSCRKYKVALDQYIEHFKKFCLLHNILYLNLNSACLIDQFVIKLVKQGICKRK